MAWKSVWKGATGDKSLPVPAENRIWTGKKDLPAFGAGRESQKSPKKPALAVGQKPNGKSRLESKYMRLGAPDPVMNRCEKKSKQPVFLYFI
jgi:hypothetical protein